MTRILLCAIVVSLLLALAPSLTVGATVTYDADTATTGAQDGAGLGWNTSNVNFWDGTANLPWPNTNGDEAVFGANSGAAGSVTVGTVTANKISFTAPVSGAYTLTGGTITLSGTTPTIAANVAATINSALSASGGYTKSGAGTLTIGASYTGGTITVGNGVLALASSIADDGMNPSTKQIVINSGGTLRYLANNKMQNNVLVTVSSGGTLDMNGLSDVFGQLAGGGSVLVGAGITLDGYSNPSTQIFSGVISGANGLTLRSLTGTQVLSGANTYSGRTQIQNGTLSVASLNSVVGGSASSHLGAPTTAANGTIALGSGTSTGRLLYTGAGETTDRVVNLAGTTGGGTLDQSGTGLLKFTSAFTATGGGSKTLTLQGSTAGTGEIAGAIVDNSAANKTSLTKSGTGTWTLSGANTYTGATTVAQGTLRITNASALGGTTGGTTINGDVSGSGILELTGGISFASEPITFAARQGVTDAIPHLRSVSGNNTWNGPITLTTGGATYRIESVADKLTVAGNITQTNSGPRNLYLQGSGEGLLSGSYLSSGSSDLGTTLTKTGTGTWTLSGANTYKGATTVTQGTLVAGSAGALPSTTALTVGTGTTVATLDMSGFDQTVASLASSSNSAWSTARTSGWATTPAGPTSPARPSWTCRRWTRSPRRSAGRCTCRPAATTARPTSPT